MSETSKKVSDAIKPVLADAISAQAYAALVAIPGFGWIFALPVVSNVTKFIINKVTTWAIQETAVGFSLLWIQIDMAYEIYTVEDATKRLKDMLNNPQKYSEKEQVAIEKHYDEAAVELINISLRRL